jgi:hypothetical protein
VIVAALGYYFTKQKDREADWRKYKYEQYKEFMVSMSGILGMNSTADDRRRFPSACNAHYLIGSKGVIHALDPLLVAVADNSNLPKDKHDELLSKLLWEIRQDVGIPGTPDASEFSARLWSSGSSGTGI